MLTAVNASFFEGAAVEQSVQALLGSGAGAQALALVIG